MVGIYDYTVILTYLSSAIALLGIGLSIKGYFFFSIVCVLLCGVLDMFDGPVARTKKNRSELKKGFGIQIDSMSDLLAFGILPSCIGFMLRPELGPEKLICIFYPLAGLIRLSFYNVQETERQKETKEKRRFYTGLPITTAAIIFPVYFLLSKLLKEETFYFLYMMLLLIAGILFIVKIKIPKPGKRGLIILSVLAAVLLALIFIFIL